MSARDDFLVEIGTEELPPKALLKLSEVFRREIEKRLDDHALAHGEAEAFATPRRLAVKIAAVATQQDDQRIERRGPALKAAFDDAGNPTKAAIGFAKSCGVEVEQLERLQTDKGEWLSFQAEVPGRPSRELLPEIVAAALKALPIPKPMRWGAGSAEFVRPVHWVVMLLGAQTVDATILGVQSGASTRGHRFHQPRMIALTSPRDYPACLENEGFVIADFAKRRDLISGLAAQAAEQANGRALIDENLLDEVTALVEWPVAVLGSFDAHFLELPREVLVASMQDHQKYFPVESHDGTLTNRFITISNIASTNPDAVRAGNERVIRPRLSDAAFFWAQDRKTPLEQRAERLQGIVFEKRLGSIKDKTDRVERLAGALAPGFGAETRTCERVARLSRCDLVTDMVGEFPELQGLMGSYYAAADGEPQAVSRALGDFYKPRFAGDTVPETPAGLCAAYSDKIDTLIGIFAIGSAPTGDRDPFALRRAALGCIRIALEPGVDVGFRESLDLACEGYAGVVSTEGVGDTVLQFILDRLRGYFTDQGVAGSTVEAVLATQPDRAIDILRRMEAVTAFRRLPQSDALAAANKRIANILRKSAGTGASAVDPELLQEPAEHALATKVEAVAAATENLFAAQKYETYLSELAGLHDPINKFFDDVMVMSDHAGVRDNRIALLRRIHGLFSRVADISRLND